MVRRPQQYLLHQSPDVAGPVQNSPTYGDTILWPTGAQLARRGPRLIIGLGIISIGISLMIRAELGLAPYDVLHQGISLHSPLTIGQAQVVVGLVVLLAWWPLHQRPGLGTITNALGVGFAIDGVLAVLVEPTSLLLRIVFLTVGVLMVGLGIGLYIGAKLGPGPRDGLMTGFADRGVRVWRVRLALEVFSLAVGWLLGGTVGLGTILFAMAIPVLADRSLRWFTVRHEN